MSHKTIYIDIDEEITSIIDRLRKSAASEVIIVAPKRAMLLQSLVNLKLLKKESSRRRKRIMIVTQDKIGKKLIEKAGILVQGKIDNSMINDDEMIEDTPEEKKGRDKKENEIIFEDDQEEEYIGSDSYFDKSSIENPKQAEAVAEEELRSNNIDKIQFMAPGDEKKEKRDEMSKNDKKAKNAKKSEKSVKMSDIVAGPKQKAKTRTRNIEKQEEKNDQRIDVGKEPVGIKHFYKKASPDPRLENQAERFFSGLPAEEEKITRRKAGKLKETRIKSKVGRYFVFFIITFIVLAGLAWGYFNIPRADVALYLKSQEKSSSVSVEASTAVNGIESGQNRIPAALEQLTKEKSQDFEATGSKNGGGKATGKVVIYNEFSSDNQPLVSTTRLETSYGKIFRITKSVVVPGMTKVGSEIKPGAIEVDVAADKPGAEYNIDPSDFKIPGFEGSPKYDKFYAKSTKAMTGGSAGETAIISSQDIDQAKEKLTAEAEKEAVEELKNALSSGRKIFEDSIEAEIQSGTSSATVGTETDKFTYSVKVNVKTLSFSEEDVREIIKMQASGEQEQNEPISFGKPISYILSEENIKDGYVKFEAKTDVGIASEMDIENFKRGILGKKPEDVVSLAENYPTILKVDVNLRPFFVSRVPINEKQVKIEIK